MIAFYGYTSRVISSLFPCWGVNYYNLFCFCLSTFGNNCSSWGLEDTFFASDDKRGKLQMSRRGENKKLVLAVTEVTIRHAYKVLEGCSLLLSDLLVTLQHCALHLVA